MLVIICSSYRDIVQLSQAAPYSGAMLAYHPVSIAVRTRTTHSRHSHATSRSVVARASEEDVEGAASTFSLVPADAQDGLSRFRAVLAPLFFAGGALHAPDVFGAGPISNVCGVSAFTDLSTALQALTLLWAVGGPVAGVGLLNASFVGDIAVTAIASTEIIAGIDFPNVIAPASIPTPILYAQIINLTSLVALRAWESYENRNKSA